MYVQKYYFKIDNKFLQWNGDDQLLFVRSYQWIELMNESMKNFYV